MLRRTLWRLLGEPPRRREGPSAEQCRRLGMEIGVDTVIVGTIESRRPEWVHIGSKVVFGGQSRLVMHGPIRPFADDPNTYIGDLAYVGHRCIVLPGTTIGRGSLVGAHSVVTKRLPPYHIVAGDPARPIRPITALELLRYFVCRWLMDEINPERVDWPLLGREDLLWVLGLPRDRLVDGDPATPLCGRELDGLDVSEMLALLGIDPSGADATGVPSREASEEQHRRRMADGSAEWF